MLRYTSRSEATLWGNIKGQELANRCSEDLGEAATAVCQGIARIRQSQKLSFAFLRHAGLVGFP